MGVRSPRTCGFFEHTAACRDPERHRHCQGRWRGVVSLGFAPDGKRIRRKVSGKTRTVVQNRLRALHDDLDSGVRARPNYTLRHAADDWLRDGLDGRSPKTIKKNENVLAPILTAIGARRLRELTAADVQQALTVMAGRYSTAAVAMGHNALTRAIRHAEARDLVRRNVATLVDTPKGQAGRPSKSLTLEQASALLAAATDTRMHAYIALCLATGIRTEEARALRWDHITLGDPTADPPLAASVQQTGRELVFATRTGAPLDAANVRREFRAICKTANIGEHWTPRELRHSFVSLMSTSGVPIEEIARLAGHTSTRTTEIVYRRELRPVLTTGAEIMDTIFTPTNTRPSAPENSRPAAG